MGSDDLTKMRAASNNSLVRHFTMHMAQGRQQASLSNFHMERKMNLFKKISFTLIIALGISGITNAQDQVPVGDNGQVLNEAQIREAVKLDPYLINPGDVLAISVWREDTLQQEVLVRPDGHFSFPLAGDVEASGRTVEEIRETLVEKLSQYIPDIVVTVATTQIGGNKIYVIGQVNKPGEFLVNPRVDVMQALSMAGGATPFADTKDIRILRRRGHVRMSIPFNYKDLERGKRLQQNVILQPGDVVVVP